MRARPGAVLLVTGGLLLAGCGAEEGAAPVATDGPDCLAPDVLRGLELPEDLGDGAEVPARGTVPSGFTPVRALDCADPASARVAALTDAQYLGRMPTYTPEQLELLGDAAITEPTVVAIERVGDLGPLVEELNRSAHAGTVACTPTAPAREVWLVDADGQAVRPIWPSAPCDGGAARADVLLDGLETSGAIEMYAVP